MPMCMYSVFTVSNFEFTPIRCGPVPCFQLNGAGEEAFSEQHCCAYAKRYTTPWQLSSAEAP